MPHFGTRPPPLPPALKAAAPPLASTNNARAPTPAGACTSGRHRISPRAHAPDGPIRTTSHRPGRSPKSGRNTLLYPAGRRAAEHSKSQRAAARLATAAATCSAPTGNQNGAAINPHPLAAVTGWRPPSSFRTSRTAPPPPPSPSAPRSARTARRVECPSSHTQRSLRIRRAPLRRMLLSNAPVCVCEAARTAPPRPPPLYRRGSAARRPLPRRMPHTHRSLRIRLIAAAPLSNTCTRIVCV